MHIIRVHEFGDASKLIEEDLPLPEPRPGEVRVKVHAIGMNFADIYQRRGWYPAPPPFAPGTEFAGTVDKLGEGVSQFKIGDRVATASGAQAYAEYALAPVMRTAALAEHVSFEQAAALLEQGLTAHYLAVSTYSLKTGDTALVHAAAGGVGQLLVQIAKLRGARVIATVSTDEKARIARGLGADEVILYSRDDFEAETRRLTDGKGVDVVYDGVGKDTFEKSLNCLRPRGMLALFGFSSGPVAPFDPAVLGAKGSLFLTRPGLNQYIATREELVQRTSDLFAWLALGALRPRIDRVLPLAEAATAHRELEARHTAGKILLVP